MKLIDLILRKNKNKKIPKRVLINGNTYTYSEEINDYRNDKTRYGYFSNTQFFASEIFKTEVEVIEEEKEIEEIDICTGGIMGFDGVENITGALKDKINELVREVRKLKDKE